MAQLYRQFLRLSAVELFTFAVCLWALWVMCD